jgi:hypothetical protein
MYLLGFCTRTAKMSSTKRTNHFPVNTSMIGNLWAIYRNPRGFPHADTFRPEMPRADPNAKGRNPFGRGRGHCSGQQCAEQGLFYLPTWVIWYFDLKPGLDEDVSESSCSLEVVIPRYPFLQPRGSCHMLTEDIGGGSQI